MFQNIRFSIWPKQNECKSHQDTLHSLHLFSTLHTPVDHYNYQVQSVSMNENLTLQGHTLDNVPLSWYRVVTQHTVKGLKQCSLTQSLLQWKIPSATTAPHTRVSCYLCEDSPSDMTTPCYSKMHISKMTN